MRLRPLHGTTRPVSALGLGTVKFGRNQQVKYPGSFELPTDAEILALLDLAREEGLVLLDTAPAYGTSEERLGRLLGARREQWTLVSKAGEEFEGGTSRFDFSPAAITASVERSLSRLRTDRIDCLLLHSDGKDLDVLDRSGAVEALRDLKAQGKILAAGISTKTVEGGLRAVELGLDAVMVAYNPWQREEEPVLDAAGAAGTTVFLKKALGSGWFGGGESPESTVESALRFVFSHPATTAAVVGTINPAHLRENCRALRAALGEV
jgi:aryl-alcohol dehydrogenase-like predicted oxidoreductase